jgi:hypothetical protein
LRRPADSAHLLHRVPNPTIFFLCAGRLWSRLGRSLRNDIGPEKDAVSRCAALGHLFPIQSKPGDPIPRAMRSRWAGRSRIPASGVNAELFSKVFHQPF